MHAGGDEGFLYWWDRLAAVTGRYSRVLMLGDSMGATAALLFSPLATSVHAFTPQAGLLTLRRCVVGSVRHPTHVDLGTLTVAMRCAGCNHVRSLTHEGDVVLQLSPAAAVASSSSTGIPHVWIRVQSAGLHLTHAMRENWGRG